MRLDVHKMAPFELDAGLSPLEEVFTELSDQIIVHLTTEVIHQVLRVIQADTGKHLI